MCTLICALIFVLLSQECLCLLQHEMEHLWLTKSKYVDQATLNNLLDYVIAFNCVSCKSMLEFTMRKEHILNDESQRGKGSELSYQKNKISITGPLDTVAH